MNGIATVTTRGQTVIPLQFRKYLKLKPTDKVYFRLVNKQVVLEPVLTVRQLRGSIVSPYKRPITKKEMKEAVAEAVAAKHKNR